MPMSVLSFLCALFHGVDSLGSSSFTSFEFKPHGEPTEYTVSEGVDKPYTVISQEFYSQGFPLLPGQMLFTNPAKTPIPMPSGKFAIVGLVGDIAKEDGNGGYETASLAEVYDHHWIVEDMHHRNVLCPHGPNYVFGIGAESRNSPVSFPKGHGYVVDYFFGDKWGANIHLLRTDSGKILTGEDPWQASKECAECYYEPSGHKGPMCTPERNGTFQCCGDNCFDGSCFCPVKPNTPQESRTYALRYRLNYTRDLDAITPLGVGVFTTPSCAAFYEVYENNEEPEVLSSTTFPMKVDSELMLSVGHLHTGAINISYFVNDQRICTSYPGYGTKEDEPGNELGHLVSMSTCFTADDNGGKGIKVKAGDQLRLDAWYWVGRDDKRIAPAPGGSHLNVMAYMYTAYKIDRADDLVQGITTSGDYVAPKAGCTRAVKNSCSADFGFPDLCIECAHMHRVNESAGCTADEIESVCLHTSPMMGRSPSSSGSPRRSGHVLI